MARPSTENDEFSFDDNGLKKVFQSSQQIVSSECISESDRKDSKPSLHVGEAIATRTDEDRATHIFWEERKSKSTVAYDDKSGATTPGESPGTVNAITDNENTQALPKAGKDSLRVKGYKDNLDLPVCLDFKKEVAEHVDGRSTVRPEGPEAREAIFRSERSAKDGSCSSGSAYPGMLALMAYRCKTFVATISGQFSVCLAVGILLLMPAAGVQGVLTSVPINTLSMVGHTVRMNCSTNLSQPVYWARTVAGSSLQQWLYYGTNGFNGNNADGRFTIDKNETMGRYDVIISDVQPKDAGQYVCVDDSGVGAKASAELVVSDPISCKSHIPSDGVMGYNVFGLEQDFIQASCSLTYAGNLSPTLEWSWPGSEMESVEPTVLVSTSSITSTLNLSPTKERDKAQFQCKANIEGATRNSIDSELRWESETVKVRYAEFVSEEVDVCPGVTWNLICNPQCSYQFERKDQGCQCLYTYYDTGTQQKYNISSDVVKCNDNDKKVVIIITTAAAFLIMGATIAASVYCLTIRKLKRRLADDSEESDQIRNDDNPKKAMIEPISISIK